MVGKWHLCPTDEMNLASTRRNWPTGPRLRALVRVPRRRDEPVVSRPRLRQPPGRPAAARPEEGYHLTDDLTDKALEFIKDAKAIAPEKPFFLYYAPGRLPRPAPRARRSGSTSSRASSTWATRRCASRRSPARRSWASSRPTPSCRRSTRSARPRRAPGPDGQPFPTLDYTRPWDSLNDDEKRLFARMAEVYAGFLAHADHHIGRLLDYLEQTGELREHDRRRRLRQRRERRGRPERLGQRDEVRQRRSRTTSRENLAQIDDLGGPKTYNHYPNGWAMAFNTPFKMWKRYEFNGGTSDPCIISLAGRHRRRAARSATSTTTRSTSCRRSSTCSASRRPRRSRATPRAPFDGVSMRYSFDDAVRAVGAEDAVLRDARLARRSGTRAGRRSPRTRRSPAGATSTTTSGSSTTPTSTAPSSTTSRREQPGQAAGAGQHLVLGGRARTARSRSTTARRSRSCCTPRPQLDRAARPLRLLPRHVAACPSGRRSTPATARS